MTCVNPPFSGGSPRPWFGSRLAQTRPTRVHPKGAVIILCTVSFSYFSVKGLHGSWTIRVDWRDLRPRMSKYSYLLAFTLSCKSLPALVRNRVWSGWRQANNEKSPGELPSRRRRRCRRIGGCAGGDREAPAGAHRPPRPLRLEPRPAPPAARAHPASPARHPHPAAHTPARRKIL